jgi:hypothetical protein
MPEKNCNADISKHLFFPITDPNLAVILFINLKVLRAAIYQAGFIQA